MPRIHTHLALLLLLSTPSHESSAQIQRCAKAGLAASERIEAFEHGSDGSYFVAGWPWTGDLSFVDMEVMKLDADGALVWGRILQGGSVEYAKSVAPTGDGGAVVAGYTRSFTQDDWDLVAVKLSASGDVQWTTTVGTVEQEYAFDAVATTDGGLAFAGSADNDVELQDGLVVKLEGDGQLAWARRVHAEGISGIELHEVVNAPDNGLLVTGYKMDVANGGLVIRFDADGNVLWAKELPYGLLYGAAQFGNDGFVLTGYHFLDQVMSQDICVLRIDDEGELLWGKKFPIAGSQTGISVAARPNGGLVVAGDHMVGTNDMRMLVLALDDDGEQQWNSVIGTQATKSLGIHAKADNGFVLGGGDGFEAIIDFLDSDGMPCPACGVSSLTLTPEDLQLLPFAVTTEAGGSAGSGSWSVVPNSQTTSSTLCLVVGSKDRQEDLEPNIFPNPTWDVLEVQLPKRMISANVEVIDALGQVVGRDRISLSTTRVDVRHLAAGAYRILFRTDQASPKSMSFIIAR